MSFEYKNPEPVTTLRDCFAAMCLASVIRIVEERTMNDKSLDQKKVAIIVASRCYMIADAMIEARERPTKEKE